MSVKGTKLETDTLALIARTAPARLPPEREFVFAAPRRFRFDFAWPEQRVALECEGAVWTNGGHTRGSGWTKNADKYNLAAAMGWRVLRVSSEMLRNRPGEFMDTLIGALSFGEEQP